MFGLMDVGRKGNLPIFERRIFRGKRLKEGRSVSKSQYYLANLDIFDEIITIEMS